MNYNEYISDRLNELRYKINKTDSDLLKIKILKDILTYLPKEPPYHDKDILYTERDGDGYVVEYKMRRVLNRIEHAYCRYDLNLRTGEFEDNPRHLVYLNCIFRRATPKEQKMLEEAIREASYKRTKRTSKGCQSKNRRHPSQSKILPRHNK